MTCSACRKQNPPISWTTAHPPSGPALASCSILSSITQTGISLALSAYRAVVLGKLSA